MPNIAVYIGTSITSLLIEEEGNLESVKIPFVYTKSAFSNCYNKSQFYKFLIEEVLKERYYASMPGASLRVNVMIYLDPEITEVRVHEGLEGTIAIWIKRNRYLGLRIKDTPTGLDVSFPRIYAQPLDSIYLGKEPDRVVTQKGFLIEETLRRGIVVIWSLKEGLLLQGWSYRKEPLTNLWGLLFLKEGFPDFLYRILMCRLSSASSEE